MIIFGTAGREIAKGKIRAACANCKEPNNINMFIVQRYAHVYGIPFFPTEKKAVTECISCNHVLEKKQFPESYIYNYLDMKSTAKAPIWMFTGLGIIAIIIFVGIIAGIRNDNENAELVLSPKKGDIYEIKLSYKQYTLYKVDKVEGNAVYFFENEYISDKTEGLKDLLQKPFYTESVPIMRTDLKAMLEKGDIMDIER